MKNHKVFVYGTLRKMAEDPTLWYVPGTALFNLGAFPAAAESRYFRVIGQILEVDDEGLKELDRYESVDSGLYVRKEVNCMRLDDDKGLFHPFMYMAGQKIIDFVAQERSKGRILRIKSGDWHARH